MTIPNFVPSSSVLVLIDFQKGVLERPPGAAVPPGAAAAVDHAGQAASVYRSASLPVVMVGVQRRADYADVAAHGTDIGDAQSASQNESPPRRLVEGTPDADFDPRLEHASTDFVVVKRRVSAFYATPLEVYLKAVRATTLVIGGVYTHMGVEATIRDAFDRDYDVVVLSDACWSPLESSHEHAITQTFPQLARVRTVSQLVESMA